MVGIGPLPFVDEAVAERFAAYDEPAREQLLKLRAHIIALAEARFGPDRLVESLKWNQPSFNIVKPKRGTTLRMSARDDGGLSLYFTCTSGLVARFREIYGDALTFQGNRELQLGQCFEPNSAVDHCILMALDPHSKG